MANQEPEGNDVLTKVAKTVGTALGTVAAAASEIGGGKPEPAEQPAQKKGSKRASSASNDAQARAQQRKKAKRTKHRRKLHRKTAG